MASDKRVARIAEQIRKEIGQMLGRGVVSGEAAKTRLDRRARERVQHNVDAAAPGRLEDLVGEAEGSRVHHVLDALIAEPCALFVAARRGQDRGADAPGKLDGRLSGAAGGRVDEHALAAAKPGEIVEGVPRRRKYDRDPGRLLRRKAARKRNHMGRARDGVCRERAGRHREHPLAWPEVRDALADLEDGARALASERDAALQAGQRPERHQHVAEVQAGRRDLDEHVAGTWTRTRHLPWNKAVEHERRVRVEDIRAIAGRLGRRGRGGGAAR